MKLQKSQELHHIIVRTQLQIKQKILYLIEQYHIYIYILHILHTYMYIYVYIYMYMYMYIYVYVRIYPEKRRQITDHLKLI